AAASALSADSTAAACAVPASPVVLVGVAGAVDTEVVTVVSVSSGLSGSLLVQAATVNAASPAAAVAAVVRANLIGHSSLIGFPYRSTRFAPPVYPFSGRSAHRCRPARRRRR